MGLEGSLKKKYFCSRFVHFLPSFHWLYFRRCFHAMDRRMLIVWPLLFSPMNLCVPMFVADNRRRNNTLFKYTHRTRITYLLQSHMMRSNMTLFDLPQEILLIIFKKLCNKDLLYSLMGTGSEQLDRLVQDPIFTNTLTFVSTDVDETRSIDNSIMDRFCIHILPRIHHNVQYLTFQSTDMQRILLAGDYCHLTKLQIFDCDQQTFARCFTGNEFRWNTTWVRDE